MATAKLAQQIDKWTASGANQVETEINGLSLVRWASVTPPTSYTHSPSICLIAQGNKRVRAKSVNKRHKLSRIAISHSQLKTKLS